MDEKKVKTREGSGYLRQLYSTARNTAGTNSSNFKSLTTFLVNFIPVDKVDASELQVRVHFDDAEIDALANSIKVHGVLQPILVVQNGDRYKVIAGERRLRASKKAGIERIPARVINSDDKGVHEIALRENLDRVDLHPIEEGEGYLSLLEAQAYTSHESIAKAFLRPKSRITECIGYTKLPDATKKEIMRRNIKARSFMRKLMLVPPEQHMQLIEDAVKDLESEPTLVAASAVLDSPEAEAKPKPKREVKSFEYSVSDKAISVPGFRWKVGEGTDRLLDYAAQVEKLLADVKKVIEI
ncbi:MAG TPA: ParB/RepB/Spo0J family partition protein [Oligoflexia bacterium]|nr:ParB/RepB/Spo0J family partition protein [Oligoflexia bacterium]